MFGTLVPKLECQVTGKTQIKMGPVGLAWEKCSLYKLIQVTARLTYNLIRIQGIEFISETMVIKNSIYFYIYVQKVDTSSILHNLAFHLFNKSTEVTNRRLTPASIPYSPVKQ